jgi:hypothetical protein
VPEEYRHPTSDLPDYTLITGPESLAGYPRLLALFSVFDLYETSSANHNFVKDQLCRIVAGVDTAHR